MFKLSLEKSERQETFANIHWIREKQENSRRKKNLFLLYWLCQSIWLLVSKQTVENSSRDGNTRPPYCFLGNLYAGQEATVRTRQGTTYWLQIGKWVHQGLLSPCLFNLYEEYIMRNAGLDKAQSRINIATEISITSNTQMRPHLWQKAKRN